MTRRKPFEEYRAFLEEKGYTLLITEKQYFGSSNVYKGLCPSGHKCNINYDKLKRGGTCCTPCGREKGKKTLMKNYGVESPLQNPEIMRKVKQTLMKNYGVEHTLQNPELMRKAKETLMKNHGVESPLQNPELAAKQKATLMENYGVENPMQNPELMRKAKDTLMKNYGVEHTLQSEELHAKQKATLMKNYGVEVPLKNPEILARQKETMVQNHGVEFPLQNKEIFKKHTDTMMERHGVRSALHKPEILKKQQESVVSHKEYIFPSGKITSYQGYEHFCLDDLLEEGYKEEDIINSVDEVPIIDYTLEGVDRKYFPDIFIPKENKIIEVKCSRTMEQDLQKNLAKAKACMDQGYEFELRIYERNGKYTILNEELYV